MERTLTVMRHAKSAWPAGVGDHDRPLNARGRRDAPRIAAMLADSAWAPELVISSTSARTRETWSRMSTSFPGVEVRFDPALYHAGIGAVRAAVRAVPADVRSVLVLGHNPGWEDVVAWLTGHVVRLTTANAARLRAAGPTWADVLQPGACTLNDVLRPKELPP